MQIDPQALTTAGEVCGRQGDHLDDLGAYVGGVCDRPEAFSGVLLLFAGSYVGAVRASSKGLRRSARVSRVLRLGLHHFRDEVLDTDDRVARRMSRTRAPVAAVRVVSPAAALPGQGGPLALEGRPSAGFRLGDGTGGAHRGDTWGHRVDTRAERQLGRREQAAERDQDDVLRHAADRDARRTVGLAGEAAGGLGDELAAVRDRLEQIGASGAATVDALRDSADYDDFVEGAGEDSRDVLRDARGWWR